MFAYLRKKIIKFIYRFLIFRVIIIDKNVLPSYDHLKVFCEYTINSNVGPISFVFKEDRRKKRRLADNIFMLNNFLAELKLPENIIPVRKEISDNVLIVIKIIIFKLDYQILSEVLLDLYVENVYKYIRRNMENDNLTIKL